MTERNQRKTRVGVVVSDKADKTIVVSVSREMVHDQYKKIMRTKDKYHAHDEKNEGRTGDTVEIMETRPISKTKRWRLLNVIERAK